MSSVEASDRILAEREDGLAVLKAVAGAKNYVAGLEAEAASDKKKFYNRDRGSDRAKAAIAALDALRRRLQVFVRA